MYSLIISSASHSSPRIFNYHSSHIFLFRSSFHSIIFAFFTFPLIHFTIHIVSSLLIYVSQLWNLYHVFSDCCYPLFFWCVDKKHFQSIRRNRFCLWWLIREQSHRMMRKWENGYLWVGGNRSGRSCNHRSWFHQMIIEGYLHQSNTKSILSRITDPIL